MKRVSSVLSLLLMFVLSLLAQADPIIIDHNDTDITALSQFRMSLAKRSLHIAYGHTSHGSQITTGMAGLVDFANGGGKGLNLPTNFFAGLDLRDGVMAGDCGYYPQWVDNTRSYISSLESTGSFDDIGVDVIMWSWCGQVDDKYAAGTLESEYLVPMAQLEADYPHAVFVYMTGHVDHWDDANNKAANQMIRDYCIANDKYLYDFADIESYDPDGTFYEFAHDNCDYYAGAGGSAIGNWATEWQASHTEGVDWYSCPSAHSEALNANQKAYAAWALFSEIAMNEAGIPYDLQPGDLNLDGRVDGSDVTILAANWQADTTHLDGFWRRWEKGDVNCDGKVDGSDVTIIAGNWQYGVTAATTAVPEPSVVVLLLGMMTFGLLARRRV